MNLLVVLDLINCTKAARLHEFVLEAQEYSVQNNRLMRFVQTYLFLSLSLWMIWILNITIHILLHIFVQNILVRGLKVVSFHVYIHNYIIKIIVYLNKFTTEPKKLVVLYQSYIIKYNNITSI